jgi:hypothetical protein
MSGVEWSVLFDEILKTAKGDLFDWYSYLSEEEQEAFKAFSYEVTYYQQKINDSKSIPEKTKYLEDLAAVESGSDAIKACGKIKGFHEAQVFFKSAMILAIQVSALMI